MEKKTKTFHYKVARPPDATDLQTLLIAALDQAPKVKHRQQPLDKEGNQLRFLSLRRTHKSILFGVAVTYTKGQNQAVVPMLGEAAEVPLEQIAPPDDSEGRRTEFVEGTVYFGVFGNHVVVLQSVAFKAKQLEDYLNWILRRGIPSNVQAPQVIIVDTPPSDLRNTEVRGVRSITLKAPIEFVPQITKKHKSKDTTEDIVLRPEGLGLQWLKTAMDSVHAGFSDAFSFKDALETGDIEVRVQVIYQKKGKREDRVMLDDIAAALTHTEVEYEMKVPGLGTVGSDVLRIRENIEVEAPGGLPHPSSVFKAMAAWLESLIAEGKV